MDGPTLLLVIFAVVGVVIFFLMRKPRPPVYAPNNKVQSVALVGKRGQYQGQRISLNASLIRQQPFSIGRTQENNLVIHNDLVSRVHAQIMLDGANRWVLYDVGSVNGTFLIINNDKKNRIAQHHLRTGDQIQIGPAIFVFENKHQVVTPPSALSVDHPQPTPLPLDTGDVDLNHYQIMGELGSGGAAKVVKAQSKTGKVVAIKFLIKSDTYLYQKFQGEMRVGKTLRHPNIARIAGGGIAANNQLYYVMEFVDGWTLRDWMSSQKQLSIDQIVSVVGQTCDALHYAHQLGIYHRDIKPENVMINRQGQVKIIDFGIARIASQTTHTADGMIVGTPFYLSYEQAKGQPVDGRSDIYSMGVVLYEMLTGYVPFYSQDQDPLKVVHYHVTQKPTPPTQFNPAIPPHLEQATLRCLEKDIRLRFQNPVELAQTIGYTSPMVGGTDDSIIAKPTRPAKIVVNTGRTIPINGQRTGLYRRDINPADHLISRQHAEIISDNGRYWLSDRSTNGTFLNGMRIDHQPTLLQSGDQIRAGNTLMRFELK